MGEFGNYIWSKAINPALPRSLSKVNHFVLVTSAIDSNSSIEICPQSFVRNRPQAAARILVAETIEEERILYVNSVLPNTCTVRAFKTTYLTIQRQTHTHTHTDTEIERERDQCNMLHRKTICLRQSARTYCAETHRE